MSDLNIDLLIKMMGLTGSDNDNQALVAIRKANEMLKRVGADWETLLRGKITIVADPFASIPVTQPEPTYNRPPPPPMRPRRPDPPPAQDPSYWNPPPRPTPQPKPQPAPVHNPRTTQRTTQIVNKFPGTCTMCGHEVAAGDGFATKVGSGRWTTEHKPGQCPNTKRRGRAFTSDNLQV